MDNAWRYQQETAANGPRDASMLPVDAPRVRVANVTVNTSRSGQVQGGGTQPWGEEVTLTSAGELPVVGWYTPSGTLLSQEPVYTFTLEGDTTVCALFEGDRFIDIPANAWYLEDVMQASEPGACLRHVRGVLRAQGHHESGHVRHAAVQAGGRRRLGRGRVL